MAGRSSARHLSLQLLISPVPGSPPKQPSSQELRTTSSHNDDGFSGERERSIKNNAGESGSDSSALLLIASGPAPGRSRRNHNLTARLS